MCPGVCTATHSRRASRMGSASVRRTLGCGVPIILGNSRDGLEPEPSRSTAVEALATPRLATDGRLPRRELGGVDVGRLGRIEPGAEPAVGDDVGAALTAEEAGPTEVIGVAVGDDDGVHPLQRDAGGVEPVPEALPAGRSRHARVDEGEAAFVLEGVAVHVAEPGEADERQHEAQHARRDLGDLVGGGLLLLTARAGGGLGHPPHVTDGRHRWTTGGLLHDDIWERVLARLGVAVRRWHRRCRRCD